MIRLFAAALVAALTGLALPAPASAQTWGQPVYLNASGRPVGGSPLSEVETRAYVETGRWADGYSDRPRVYVPPPYDRGYARHRDHDRRDHGYGYGRDHDQRYSGYGHRRYDAPAPSGYRDEWGYHDDRPPSARRWSEDRRYRRHERDCGCGDVYLYDR